MASDFMARGQAWLADQLQTNDSDPVTYCRGRERVDLQATLGKKLLKLQDGRGGFKMQWTDADFLIPVSVLVLSGAEVEPQKGDTIEMESGNETLVFEVLSLIGEPGWHGDPHATMWRIHTKRVR